MKFLRRCYDWIMEMAPTPYALGLLSAMSFAEASFFPVPPDPLLIAMAVAKPRKALRYAAFCSLASVLGGILGYVIGAFLWDATADFFFAYVPGFTREGFETIRSWYGRYGFWCVFVAGFTPIPYKLFTIASGVFGMAFAPFVLASAISRSARFFLVAGLIRIFGERIKNFIDKYFNLLTAIFAILLIGCFLLVGFMHGGQEETNATTPAENSATSEVTK